MTLDQFITRHRVTMRAEQVDHNPHVVNEEWAADASHWLCRLRCGQRSMSLHFSMGAAHDGPPAAADVLDCLASDAAGFDDAGSFEDWCADYGYDIDSRQAERIYRATERQAKSLERLLGTADYQVLLYDVERL